MEQKRSIVFTASEWRVDSQWQCPGLYENALVSPSPTKMLPRIVESKYNVLAWQWHVPPREPQAITINFNVPVLGIYERIHGVGGQPAAGLAHVTIEAEGG